MRRASAADRVEQRRIAIDAHAWQSRRRVGAPDFGVRGRLSSYQAIRDGSLDRISTDVQELTGRAPVTPRELVCAIGAIRLPFVVSPPPFTWVAPARDWFRLLEWDAESEFVPVRRFF